MRLSASVGADGYLKFHDRARFVAWMRKRRGQRVEIELRDEASARSSAQNRYFHGPVCQHVADLWRQDGLVFVYHGRSLPEWPLWAVKDALVAAFGGEWAETPLGKARRSSADLTVEEFASMLDKIDGYCTHKDGAHAPLPEPRAEDL